ncbi:MAG TPA: type IV toxin-antitoxin system AbiEi family antitoxin domain-containing protein, partial [Solirubrobacterales bacterium]
MRRKPAIDTRIAGIATRQHGVITLAQLEGVGLSSAGVTRRVQAGRLFRLHRAVYTVGHAALAKEGRWMAAVLACGEAAVLSHRSAAELWAMLPPRDGPVDVTIASASGRSKRRGIRLHRCPLLPAAATAKRFGISVTTPARTLADLSRTMRPWEVRRAARQAAFDGLDLGHERGGDRTR